MAATQGFYFKMEDDDDISDIVQATPAYSRVLWIVLLLNLGYGVVEIAGGFLAGSLAAI